VRSSSFKFLANATRAPAETNKTSQAIIVVIAIYRLRPEPFIRGVFPDSRQITYPETPSRVR
jgi:hypothetical protein